MRRHDGPDFCPARLPSTLRPLRPFELETRMRLGTWDLGIGTSDWDLGLGNGDYHLKPPPPGFLGLALSLSLSFSLSLSPPRPKMRPQKPGFFGFGASATVPPESGGT